MKIAFRPVSAILDAKFLYIMLGETYENKRKLENMG